MGIDCYRPAATKYRPERMRVLFVCESPPYAGQGRRPAYFFFEDNPRGDVLFATIVAGLYDLAYRKDPVRKAELLTRMKDDGTWLIDAVEYPINADENGPIKEARRNEIIQENLSDLLRRLGGLRKCGCIDERTRLILIKKNIYELLHEPLRQAGYDVVNSGAVPFPHYHRDRETVRGIRTVLARHGLLRSRKG